MVHEIYDCKATERVAISGLANRFMEQFGEPSYVQEEYSEGESCNIVSLTLRLNNEDGTLQHGSAYAHFSEDKKEYRVAQSNFAAFLQLIAFLELEENIEPAKIGVTYRTEKMSRGNPPALYELRK